MSAASPLPPPSENATPSPILATKGTSAPTGVAPEGWGLARRIALRFAFVYFALYNAPLPWERVGLESVFEALDAPWKIIVPWVARHVLRLDAELSIGFDMGRMDSTYSYAQVAVFAMFAAGAAGLWSWVDRARRESTWPHELLRVQVRYVLATVMLSYGMSKVFQTQFPFPGPERLIAPLGELSPQELLWTFMGYSRGYNLFTGGGEVVGGLLLFSRRTTTLGALLLAIVMSNVVALNFFYDVPVKLYSSHLLLMCIFLILPDVQRLLQVLVLNQTAMAVAPREFLSFSGWRPWAVRGVKGLVIGCLVCIPIRDRLERVGRPAFPLMGLYAVESFTRDGQVRPPLVGDELRWRYVAINRYAWMTPRVLDEVPQSKFRLQDDPERKLLEVTQKLSARNRTLPLSGTPVFTYEWTDAQHLTLKGSLEGSAIEARMRKVDPAWSPLLGPGFHWTRE